MSPIRLPLGSRGVPPLALALVALAFAARAPHAAPARAAIAPDTAIVQIEPIVVRAVAPASPLTVSTDPRAPRQPVPASDGSDYLRTIPGFSAIRNGGTNGDPVLRGMFGSRLQVLTEGSCMLGACPARMDAPTSYISPESFDRLTVTKGPETVLWGPGASAGTVRFERTTSRFEVPALRVEPGLLGGSWGRNDQQIDAVAGLSQGFVRVDANRSECGDYVDGDGHVVPSEWRKWNVDGALGWTPGRSTRVELDAGAGDGLARYAGRGMDGSAFSRRSVGLRARQAGVGTLEAVEAQVTYHDADHVMDNYHLRVPDPMSAMPMPMAANVGRRSVNARVSSSLKWGDATRLVAGLDHASNRHRGRSGSGVDTYTGKPWVEDARFENLGFFAEGTWSSARRTQVVAGARLDRSAAEDRRGSTGGMMPMPNPTRGVKREAMLTSGFARLVRPLGGAVSVYAGLGHAQRFPDYWELFSPDTGPAGAVNAFSGVRPEKTTQLDVGAQAGAGRGRGWVSAYAGELAADGSPLPQIPALESRLTLDYDDGGTWSFGTLLRLVGAQERVAVDEGNVVGRDLGRSPGYAIFSLDVARRLPRGARLAAGVDNLLDLTYSEHLNLAGDAAFGYPALPVRIHEPGRTLWVKLNVKP